MDNENILLMKNEIKEYDWGGTSFIPSLLGIKEDNTPKAEMWLGAHKSSPSKVLVKGNYIKLTEFLEIHKEILEGKDEFPFLFKVLSAEKPLSIQIHPSKVIAVKGFKVENEKHIKLDDTKRVYKDENPKIELVYALSDFYALKGFLPLNKIKEIYENLKLSFHFLDHKAWINYLFNLKKEQIEQLINIAEKNVTSLDSSREHWFRKIKEIYGVDVGLLLFLGMNIFSLKEGEVFYTDSQEVHAYLYGNCIELMTNSDNVIRAGLTTKYIDTKEMLRVGKFEEDESTLLQPEIENGINVFKLPNTKLELKTAKLKGKELKIHRNKLMILLLIDGEIEVNNKLKIKKGESVFIAPYSEKLLLKGVGTIFIAS